MSKLLELKPDALGGLPATARPEKALAFSDKFKCSYQRFRKRRGFSIRRRTRVGQQLLIGHEGVAWALVRSTLGATHLYLARAPPKGRT